MPDTDTGSTGGEAAAEQSTSTTEGSKPAQADASSTEQSATDDLGENGVKALETERAARKEAERARKALERELEQFRRQAMTDSERAVADAEARGRAAAMADVGKRLARSEFAAAAARRNAEFPVADALEFVDLARFVGDDGEPDAKAIAAAVERLVPEPKGAVPRFDGGTRTDAKTTDMNEVIRRQLARR